MFLFRKVSTDFTRLFHHMLCRREGQQSFLNAAMRNGYLCLLPYRAYTQKADKSQNNKPVQWSKASHKEFYNPRRHAFHGWHDSNAVIVNKWRTGDQIGTILYRITLPKCEWMQLSERTIYLPLKDTTTKRIKGHDLGLVTLEWTPASSEFQKSTSHLPKPFRDRTIIQPA